MALEMQPQSLTDYYLTSVKVGLRSMRGPYLRQAVARVLNPLSYPRFLEYQLALGLLGPLDGCRILDIGSPKLPALLLARNDSCELYATDIRDYFVGPTAQFLTVMGLAQRLGTSLHLEMQDARRLTFEDGSFDRIFSISVLEHIPNEGDSQAMREIARVLRPGGIATLTVPFCGDGYREEFVRGPVYERSNAAGGTFYQRHYDLPTLRERLIEPSGLRVVRTVFFGEPGIRFEQFWNRVPIRWKVPLLWAQPFLAKLFLRELGPDRLGAACGVALKLEKTS